jgi:hypothetical protein
MLIKDFSKSANVQINHIKIIVDMSKPAKGYTRPPKQGVAPDKRQEEKALKLPANTVSATQGIPALTTNSHGIRLRSRTDGTHGPANVMYDATIDTNWISTDIVKRFGLKTYQIEHPVYAILKGQVLESTGECAKLSYSKVQPSRRQVFHVMERAPFDLLVGVSRAVA